MNPNNPAHGVGGFTSQQEAFPPPQNVGSTHGHGGGGLDSAWSAGQGGTTAPGTGEGDRFLNQAQGIQITQEDRQEGYDAGLVNLPTRNTVSAMDTSLPSRMDSYDTAEKGGPPSPHVGLPPEILSSSYAARDPEVERKESAKRSTERARKSRSATRDGVNGTASGSGDKRKKRKRKPSKFWQKPSCILIALGVVAVIAIGVGLGAGLGIKKKSSHSSDSGSSGNGPSVDTSSFGPTVSPAQPSVVNGAVVGVTDIALSSGGGTTYPFSFTIPASDTAATNGKIVYTETVAVEEVGSSTTILVPLTVFTSNIAPSTSTTTSSSSAGGGIIPSPLSTSSSAAGGDIQPDVTPSPNGRRMARFRA